MAKHPVTYSVNSTLIVFMTSLGAAWLYSGSHWLLTPVDSASIGAILAGAALGMLFPIYILLPTTAAFAVLALNIRITNPHAEITTIALNVLVIDIAHLIGYLFGVTCLPTITMAQRRASALFRNNSDRADGDRSQRTSNMHKQSVEAHSSLPSRNLEADSATKLFFTMKHPPAITNLTPTSDLLYVVEGLARASGTDAILAIVRTSARRLIGSDGVALILADNDKCHYVEEDAIGPLWKGRKFKMTECISGWSMINQKTAVIPDISADERIPHDLYADTFVKSMVMTPIGVNNPRGALGAYWASTYQPTDYEIEIVQTLARATATALEAADLERTLSSSRDDRPD